MRYHIKIFQSPDHRFVANALKALCACTLVINHMAKTRRNLSDVLCDCALHKSWMRREFIISLSQNVNNYKTKQMQYKRCNKGRTCKLAINPKHITDNQYKCIDKIKADRPLMRDTLNAPWLLTSRQCQWTGNGHSQLPLAELGKPSPNIDLLCTTGSNRSVPTDKWMDTHIHTRMLPNVLSPLLRGR